MHSNVYTAFQGHRRVITGPLHAVALRVKQLLEDGGCDPVLIFDDNTGRSIDIDTRGTEEEVLARFAAPETATPNQSDPSASEPRGRGRPKLGVVPREVTLLPRHWEWLSAQSGGASVALRKLVEEARRNHGNKDEIRKAKERAYHFMSAMAGDMPGFEEACRALFANDQAKFSGLVSAWPADVREHATLLAFKN